MNDISILCVWGVLLVAVGGLAYLVVVLSAGRP